MFLYSCVNRCTNSYIFFLHRCGVTIWKRTASLSLAQFILFESHFWHCAAEDMCCKEYYLRAIFYIVLPKRNCVTTWRSKGSWFLLWTYVMWRPFLTLHFHVGIEWLSRDKEAIFCSLLFPVEWGASGDLVTDQGPSCRATSLAKVLWSDQQGILLFLRSALKPQLMCPYRHILLSVERFEAIGMVSIFLLLCVLWTQKCSTWIDQQRMFPASGCILVWIGFVHKEWWKDVKKIQSLDQN